MQTPCKNISYLAFSVIAITFLFTSESFAHQVLGHYPLCEASAAITISCPDGNQDCLLVADNEQRDNLFLFPIQGNTVNTKIQKPLPLNFKDAKEISDIEALTSISKDNILVFGSHSRNKSCKAKKKRRRFASFLITNNMANLVSLNKSKKISCKHIFINDPQDNPVQNAVCKTIDIEEAMSEKECNLATPFNIEGVVNVSTTKQPDIWAGLRAPLLKEHPMKPKLKNLAILLHMANSNQFKFTDIALLDLKDRGIRELAVLKDEVWVIAGPASDSDTLFQLYRFPTSALNGDEVIHPDYVSDLPPSSEGLAFYKNKAFIVTDGDIGNSMDNECLKPSYFFEINLPVLP